MLPAFMNPSFKEKYARVPALPLLWFLLLCAFHFSFNIWWLHADRHAISTDEETHMIMARDYYTALFLPPGNESISARFEALRHIRADVGNPVHPPLLHLAGAFLAKILGYGIDRIAFANTLAFLLSLAGFYLLMGSFLSQKNTLFAVTVFSMTPMVYMASRYFMTDFLSMALVIWVLYTLWKSDGYARIGWTVLFGICNGLALLTRTTAVLYYALPCFLAGCFGVYRIFQESSGFASRWKELMKMSARMALAAGITLLLAASWYIMHGEQFYQHWMKPQAVHEETPLSILRKTAPPPQQTAAASKTEATASAADGQKENSSPKGETGKAGWRLRLHRRIPWTRYPVFVINNAVFLPMFLLSLAGMICACCSGAFIKRKEIWLLLSWLWGSYVLLTLLLSFSTPRYALQALPALAFFSALPFFLIQGGKLRRTLQGVYLALLLFQFVTLSVHAFSPLPELKLPLQPDPEFQAVYDDPGLYIYKSVLHASSAYGRMQAPMQDNFKDRIFEAMLQNEQKQPYFGVEAPYARLNMRGMLFEEQHYWLDSSRPNPFRRTDIPADLEPYRNFRHYGWGRDMEEIQPILPMVDYVVYTTEDISEAKEQEWLHILDSHDFDLIERFFEARFGQVGARYYAVAARREIRPLPEIKTQADIAALPLEALYRFRHSGKWRLLSPPLQNMLEQRIQALFEARGKGVTLNDTVTFLGATASRASEDRYILNLMFKSNDPPPLSCRLLLQGVVSPEDMAVHFGTPGEKYGQFRWSFEPSPSLVFWPEQGHVLVRFPFSARPIPYELSLAFFLPGKGLWDRAVNLGSVDFSKVPDENATR